MIDQQHVRALHGLFLFPDAVPTLSGNQKTSSSLAWLPPLDHQSCWSGTLPGPGPPCRAGPGGGGLKLILAWLAFLPQRAKPSLVSVSMQTDFPTSETAWDPSHLPVPPPHPQWALAFTKKSKTLHFTLFCLETGLHATQAVLELTL